jgi:membrane-associated phospholipid phosphatase
MQVTRRRRLDAVLAVIGLLVVVLTALLARRGTYGWEFAVFRAINDLPSGLRPFLWVLNQYGTAITIPVATAAALVFRKWRMAAALAISGVTVYLLAKAIKGWVDRGRPGALLDTVAARETFDAGSLGYPSGHAAVAWAITIIVLAYLGRPWRIAAVTLAIIVPLARMYVGAHLPLDLIGGAALGVMIASAVNLALGVPVRQPAAEVRTAPVLEPG